MSDPERELLMRLLKQSVLTLCRETVSFNTKLEVDGIICITVEDKPQPIVVKIHDNVWKSFPKQGYGDAKCSPPKKKKKRSSSQLNDSPMDSCGEGAFPYMSDISEDRGNQDNVGGLSESRPASSLSTGETLERKNQSLSISSPDSDKLKGSDDGANAEDDPRSGSAETDHHIDLSNSSNLITANLPTHSSAVSHPQGLLCKRCFTIVPDVMSFDTHNLREHSLFTCRICFKGFTARNNLKRHFRLHTGVRPYKCSVCTQGFTRKDDLKAHVLRHSYNKPFRCSICGKGYTDRSCVRNHMAKEHHTKLTHVCPQCGEGFSDDILFSRHKKTHPEFKNFQCEGCSFIGINALDLMKHSLTHSTKSYSCKPCNQQFSDPFQFSSHLKTHKSDESFTSYACCFCSVVLTTYDQFIRHEYSHAQSRTQSCNICSKQFRFASDLKAHTATHNEPMNLATATPEDENTSQDQEEEATVSSQYWCTECQIGFPSEETLHDHIYKAHESTKVNREVEPDTPMIELRKENLKFTNDIQAMKLARDDEPLHEQKKDNVPHPVPDDVPMVDLSQTKLPQLAPLNRVKSEPRPSLFPRLSSPRKNDPETVVDLNGDPMTIKREITDHEEELRTLQEEFMPSNNDYPPDASPNNDSSSSQFDGSPGSMKEIVLERIHIRSPGFERVVTPEILFRSQTDFQCQVCQEPFKDFSNFEIHSSSLHRRFVCEYCGKIFTAKPNRERHVRYHTGERPYKCDLCDQTFFRGDDLKYHRTTRHSGVKPFQCSSCRMTFAWAKDLERHMRHFCH